MLRDISVLPGNRLSKCYDSCSNSSFITQCCEYRRQISKLFSCLRGCAIVVHLPPGADPGSSGRGADAKIQNFKSKGCLTLRGRSQTISSKTSPKYIFGSKLHDCAVVAVNLFQTRIQQFGQGERPENRQPKLQLQESMSFLAEPKLNTRKTLFWDNFGWKVQDFDILGHQGPDPPWLPSFLLLILFVELFRFPRGQLHGCNYVQSLPISSCRALKTNRQTPVFPVGIHQNQRWLWPLPSTQPDFGNVCTSTTQGSSRHD